MTQKTSRTYTIKDLAAEFEVTSRTLRHYEEQGLLLPERSGQTRIYSEADRARLSWILRGRRVGFSLSEIGEMLALYDLGDGRITQRQVTLQRCRARISDLEAQRDDIDATIRELGDFCDLLEHIVFNADTEAWVHEDSGKPVRHDPTNRITSQ